MSYQRALAILAVAAFALAFQETGLLPALPRIQRELHASKTASGLLESAFLLVASIAAPLLGKLGDRFGKKRLLVTALAVYFVGAIGAALAPDMWVLVGFRALQGTGGAIFGLSFAILRDTAGQERLSVVIGVMVGAFGVGMAAGFASVGGLEQAASWRVLFWIGAGLVAVATALVALGIHEAGERHGEHTDVAGALLLGGAPTAIVVGLALAPATGWASWPVIGLLVLGVVLGLVWVWFERRGREPLLDVGTLAQRVVLLPNVGSLLAGWAAFSLLFVVPRFVQAPHDVPPAIAAQLHYGFHATSAATGGYLVPFAIGIVIAGPLGGVIGRRWGGKGPFVVGLALLGVAGLSCALAHGGPWLVRAWLLIAGLGFGASIGAAGTFVTESVDPGSTGVATTFNSVMRLAGGGIGAELAAGLLATFTIGGSDAAHLGAFDACFWIAAGVAFAGAGLGLLVPRRERDAPAPDPRT